MKRAIDFTKGNIVQAIVLFSIPLIMGELLQNLYNSVDALVVGNLVDQHALAAVTVCGVIANMVVNFLTECRSVLTLSCPRLPATEKRNEFIARFE